MKTEDEEKNKSTTVKKAKRKLSIFTVIIWVALVVTMSVIVVQGVNKTNALEEGETRKITVKLDFNEFFEKEGITEETEKVRFMRYQYGFGAVKTNNLMEESDFYGRAIFITNEENIGVYEIEITNEARYIMYHPIGLIPYRIESETNEIEYINDNKYGDTYYGEEIKEDQDIYEVKLKEVGKINLNIENILDGAYAENDIEIKIVRNNQIIGQYRDSFVKINEKYICRKEIYDIEEEYDILIPLIYIKNPCTIFEHDGEIENGEDLITCYESKELDLIEYEGEKYYVKRITKENKKDEYNFILTYPDPRTYVTKKAKWINKDMGIARIDLGYTSTYIPPLYITTGGKGIYFDTLSDEFELLPEHYNDSKWSILETVSEEKVQDEKVKDIYKNIPLDVYNEFYSKNDNEYTNKKYVYVKDTKTIYWCEDNIKAKIESISINVVYNGLNKLNEEIVITNKDASLYCIDDNYSKKETYNIATPSLKYIHTQEGIIKVSKIIDKTEGKSTCYVGIFEKEDNVTDKIYSMEMIDGKGDIIIEIPNYDKNKEYYIYEVDKEGNKISDKKITYSSNKAEFNYIRDSKIESDKSVVSSVMSDKYEYRYDNDNVDTSKWHEYVNEDGYTRYYFETDAKNSKGTGEEDYIDNVLSVNDIYQASVTITSKKKEEEEKKYKVEYVAEEGGIIDGEQSEIVNPGEIPSNIPTPRAEDGYKFVRWEVEENGERIEVVPSEYVIEKDTVFYAIFEKVEVVDTSDINIWIYVGVIVVAVIVAIVTIIVIKKNKNKK